MYVQIFQYFQNFASICAQNSVKILANPYTWRLWDSLSYSVIVALNKYIYFIDYPTDASEDKSTCQAAKGSKIVTNTHINCQANFPTVATQIFTSIVIFMYSPAVYNVWSFGRSHKVFEVSYEGDDWMRVIGDTKVWPASVVELFHWTSLSASPWDLEWPYGVVSQLYNIDWTDGDVLQGQSTIS